MRTYNGNIEITKENEKEWSEKLKGIEEITGYLDVSGSAQLPNLKTVGGSVVVYGSAQLDAPKLKTVGGSVAVSGSAQLDAPKDLKNEQGESVKNELKRALCLEFENDGFLFADGILSKLVSRKKIKQVLAYKVKTLGLNKVQYVVQKGDVFSHGNTIEKAIHDLRYKLTDRDTSKYNNWTMDSVHPIADVIGAYRAITGACETGTKMWCEGQTLPERISVKLAIEKTKGAYGSEQFKAFFEGAK